MVCNGLALTLLALSSGGEPALVSVGEVVPASAVKREFTDAGWPHAQGGDGGQSFVLR